MDVISFATWIWFGAGLLAVLVRQPDSEPGHRWLENCFFFAFGFLSLAVVWSGRVGEEHYSIGKTIERIGWSGITLTIFFALATYQLFLNDGQPLW